MTHPFRLMALTALPLIFAAQAGADTLTGKAAVSAVTLFPQGASITRSITMEATPGQHRIVLPGLPQDLDPSSLRISGAGLRIGSTTLQQGRAEPDLAEEDPALVAARDTLEAALSALRAHDARIESLRAEAQAAAETVDVLTELAKSQGRLTADTLALMDQIEARILTARQTAIRVDAEVAALMVERQPLERAYQQADAALQVVLNEASNRNALVIEGEVVESPFQIEITSMTGNAGWGAVYDLRLDTDAESLAIDRGASVAQWTGEDWSQVALTLSTARPTSQTAPSALSSMMVSLFDPRAVVYERARGGAPEAMVDMAAPPAPAAAAAAQQRTSPITAEAMRVGLVMTYRFPQPVDIRTGVDALRLAMDSREVEATIRAEANAARDDNAFLVAKAQNSDEPILPGEAALYTDGVMIGKTPLGLIAEGDEIHLGFGPIDGLTIERRTPRRSEGTRGLMGRAEGLEAVREVLVANRTSRDWTLMLTDRVAVTEDEKVKISWTADPAPDRTEPDSRRGILEWDLSLKPGDERLVTTTTTINWPAGEELTGFE